MDEDSDEGEKVKPSDDYINDTYSKKDKKTMEAQLYQVFQQIALENDIVFDGDLKNLFDTLLQKKVLSKHKYEQFLKIFNK